MSKDDREYDFAKAKRARDVPHLAKLQAEVKRERRNVPQGPESGGRNGGAGAKGL